MTKLTTIGTLAVGVMLSTSAFAQDPAAPEPMGEPAAAGMEAAPAGGPPPITGVRAGGLAVWASLNVNLSKSAVAKPFGISPDIIYGVSDGLSVALAHSTYALTGFAGGVSDSLCLAGTSKGCAKAYNRLGLLAKYALGADMAADGGLVISSLDPNMMALKLGVSGRTQAGPVMVMYDPNILIGINERDAGNKEFLNVPVMGMVPVSTLMVGAQTGIAGPLDGFGDFYRIPLSLLAVTSISPTLKAGAALTFFNIAGKNSSADSRALNIFVGWNN